MTRGADPVGVEPPRTRTAAPVGVERAVARAAGPANVEPPVTRIGEPVGGEGPVAEHRPTYAVRKSRAIALLVAGQPVTAIARDLGVSQRTLRRYFEDSRDEIIAAQREQNAYLANRVRAAAERALAVAEEIIEDARTPAYVRLGAIGRILDAHARLSISQPAWPPPVLSDAEAGRLAEGMVNRLEPETATAAPRLGDGG